MARKPKPFQQKRKTPAPYRRGSTFTFYVSYDLKRAIADVARARGNISQSELVSSILTAHPDIAAQLELYQQLDGWGADQGPTGADVVPESGQWGQWEDMPGLWPDRERPDAGARKKRGQRRGSDQEALLLLTDQEEGADQGSTAHGARPAGRGATKATNRKGPTAGPDQEETQRKAVG